MPSPSSSAEQARRDLGARLREIRVDAGLTARDLGRLIGRHASKVSRIEHGSAVPSPTDIHDWCEHCGASDQIGDLIAAVKAVESMWVEWRRMERTGLRRSQEAVLPLYERTRQFRVYTPHILPGIVQTRAYTTAILSAIGRRRSLPDDIDSAVRVRMDRQRLLYEGDHRFAILLEGSALRAGIGGTRVMAGQLGHLITVSSLPSLSLGVIPDRADRDAAWPVEGFWLFDNTQANVELISGHLTVTQPREIAMYAQVFAELSELAIFGDKARSVLTRAIDALE